MIKNLKSIKTCISLLSDAVLCFTNMPIPMTKIKFFLIQNSVGLLYCISLAMDAMIRDSTIK